MTDRKLYQGGRGTSIGKEALIIHGVRQFAKLAMMLARMKEWCKQNPGKKALLSSSSELSQTLTYDVGNKIFIYSTVKLPLEPTTVDEFRRDWFKEQYYKRSLQNFEEQYMSDWNGPFNEHSNKNIND